MLAACLARLISGTAGKRIRPTSFVEEEHGSSLHRSVSNNMFHRQALRTQSDPKFTTLGTGFCLIECVLIMYLFIFLFFNLIFVCRRFRLKMTPSLDIYCFGMVALFIFTEKNWWANLARPLPKVPTADDISSRQKQAKAMIVSMERSDCFFQTIGQQIRGMLNHNPKNRPHARDCVFEFCDPATINDEYGDNQ